MGVFATEPGPTNKITDIHFKALKEYDWPFFAGTLSSGLSFPGTPAVSLAEVIARYGKPMHTLAHVRATSAATSTNFILHLRQKEAILQSGESLLMTLENGAPDCLYYPASGIYFNILNIQNGKVVHSFRIFEKVEPRPAPNR